VLRAQFIRRRQLTQAENRPWRRRDAGPIEARAGKQRVAHVLVEIGEAEIFFEESTVDVRENGEGFVEILLALFEGCIENVEKTREVLAEIGAVSCGAVNEIEAESFAVENVAILSEEAEKDADEKAFEGMARVAASFKRVVKIAHDFDGFDVRGVLVDESVLLVSSEEGKVIDVVMKIGEGEFDGTEGTIIEEREAPLVVGLQIVEGDACEVRDDDVTRDFFVAVFAGEVLNVTEGLRFGFAEVFAAAFVFDEDDARPEEVNIAVIAGEPAHGFLEAGHGAARNTENIEKFVPEGLLFGLLALCARPFLGKGDGAVTNFIP
jgi:hypothetical protein